MDRKTLRKQFRDAVFKRDNYRCRACGYVPAWERALEELDAHHIVDRHDLPAQGMAPENGITLCQNPRKGEKMSCHMKAEVFHASKGQRSIAGFHPDDLYKMIGSTYEHAYEASARLENDDA